MVNIMNWLCICRKQPLPVGRKTCLPINREGGTPPRRWEKNIFKTHYTVDNMNTISLLCSPQKVKFYHGEIYFHLTTYSYISVFPFLPVFCFHTEGVRDLRQRVELATAGGIVLGSTVNCTRGWFCLARPGTHRNAFFINALILLLNIIYHQSIFVVIK